MAKRRRKRGRKKVVSVNDTWVRNWYVWHAQRGPGGTQVLLQCRYCPSHAPDVPTLMPLSVLTDDAKALRASHPVCHAAWKAAHLSSLKTDKVRREGRELYLWWRDEARRPLRRRLWARLRRARAAALRSRAATGCSTPSGPAASGATAAASSSSTASAGAAAS